MTLVGPITLNHSGDSSGALALMGPVTLQHSGGSGGAISAQNGNHLCVTCRIFHLVGRWCVLSCIWCPAACSLGGCGSGGLFWHGHIPLSQTSITDHSRAPRLSSPNPPNKRTTKERNNKKSTKKSTLCHPVCTQAPYSSPSMASSNADSYSSSTSISSRGDVSPTARVFL